jgi:hypothetical protein
MFEKDRKALRSAVVPPVIGNHGLTGRSLLKQTEDSCLIGLQSLEWTSPSWSPLANHGRDHTIDDDFSNTL